MSLTWSAKDHKNTSQTATTGQKRSRGDTGNKVTVVLGAQWGDEGKGKVVDLLATEADVVCRCQVNAQICIASRVLAALLNVICFLWKDFNKVTTGSVGVWWGATGARGENTRASVILGIADRTWYL